MTATCWWRGTGCCPNPLTPAQVTELTRFGVDHLGYPYNPSNW